MPGALKCTRIRAMGVPSGPSTCSVASSEAVRCSLTTIWNGSPGWVITSPSVPVEPARAEGDQREQLLHHPDRPRAVRAPRGRHPGRNGRSISRSVLLRCGDRPRSPGSPGNRSAPARCGRPPRACRPGPRRTCGRCRYEPARRISSPACVIDEARLPLLPGEPDQGRAEDVHPQERQQDGEPGAAVDVLVHRRRAVPLLEEGGVASVHASVDSENTASFSEARKR